MPLGEFLELFSDFLKERLHGILNSLHLLWHFKLLANTLHKLLVLLAVVFDVGVITDALLVSTHQRMRSASLVNASQVGLAVPHTHQ